MWMDLSFIKTELLRKRVALSLAILAFLTISFISMLNVQINALQQNIAELENYKIEQETNFLSSRVALLDTHLNLIESQWHEFSEGSIEEFIDRYLYTITDLVYLTVVIVKDQENEVIWHHYGATDYLEYEHIFLFEQVRPVVELQVLNGEVELPFGVGERFFVKGRMLEKDETTYLIQTGFHEQVLFQRFISTLDITLLTQTRQQITNILYSSVAFFFAVVVYGIVLLGLIRWFVVDAIKEYANTILMDSIPVKDRGDITSEQLQQVLNRRRNMSKKR